MACFKLLQAGQEKDNHLLLDWVKEIVRHFWFCAEKADGSKEMFLVSHLLFFETVTLKTNVLVGISFSFQKTLHWK